MNIIKTFTDNQNGRKWEIIDNGGGDYAVKYYEYFAAIGWRLTATDAHCSRDYIRAEFDI